MTLNSSKSPLPSGRFWNPEARRGRKGDQDDALQRPAIINRLLRNTIEGQEHTSPEFKQFERQVQDNDVQIARFDFLKMTSFYEGSLIGPSDAKVPDHGASCLEMIFAYYAGRRQADTIDPEHGLSFHAQAEANSTMDLPELERFTKDFFPGVFNRKEVLKLFKQANMMNGISDDNVFTLQMEEFICLICQMGMQLFRGRDAAGIVKGIGDRLKLNNPIEMRSKLRQLGRMNAGFGAWTSDDVPKVTPFNAEVRTVLGEDATKWILPPAQLLELKDKMASAFPVLHLPEWLPFKGRYIALAAPVNQMRKNKPIRFKLTIRNRAPRKFAIHGRVLDMNWMGVKQSAAGDGIAPGMDFTQQLIIENVPPGHHLGAIVFSAKEGGPELFRCPIYIRGVEMSRTVLSDDAHRTLARSLNIEAWRRKFKAFDIARTGSVSQDNFQQVVAASGADVGSEEMQLLLSEVDTQDGTINYDDLLEHMGEVVPDATPSAVRAALKAASEESELQRCPSAAEAPDASHAPDSDTALGEDSRNLNPGRTRSPGASLSADGPGRTSSAAEQPGRTQSGASAAGVQRLPSRAPSSGVVATVPAKDPNSAEGMEEAVEEARARARRVRLDAGKVDAVEQRVLRTGFAAPLQVGLLPSTWEIHDEVERAFAASPDRLLAGADALSSAAVSLASVSPASLHDSLHSPLPRMRAVSPLPHP